MFECSVYFPSSFSIRKVMVIQLWTLQIKYLPFHAAYFLQGKLCYFPDPPVNIMVPHLGSNALNFTSAVALIFQCPSSVAGVLFESQNTETAGTV